MPARTRRRDLPSSQKCIVQADLSAGPGSLSIAYSWPLPELGPRDVLVETLFVALNPCDVKIPAAFPSPGCIDGCDFAGTVVALGPGLVARGDGVRELEKSPDGCNVDGAAHRMVCCEWDIGDRVFGAVSGSTCPEEKHSGSFAEFVKAPSDFIWRIPDGMSFEQAMGFSGVCITTMGVALFRSLQLPGTLEVPATSPQDVLIYGGSTCTGSFGIQMVKLMGHRAITTCSPKNLALARRCGADEILDYKSPTCSADIKRLTRNSLKYVVDPFADVKTTVLCLDSMGRAGGRYCALDGLPGVEEVARIKRNTVKRQVVVGAAILGAGVIRLGDGAGADSGESSAPLLPESDELTAWGIQFFRSVQLLLDEQRLKGHPTRLLNPAGEEPFHAILEGLELLKQKRVSGEKLVVRMKM